MDGRFGRRASGRREGANEQGAPEKSQQCWHSLQFVTVPALYMPNDIARGTADAIGS
jgi:hypothetical protein